MNHTLAVFSRTPVRFLLLLPLIGGCTRDVEEPQDEEIPARAPELGELLITQLYTSGAPPAGGADHYFADQFIELFNTASDPLDLSGLGIADVFGSAGRINPGMAPDSFREERPDEVVMSSVWRIPSGARLEPQEAVIIAHDGANHRPFSDLDLSSAGFEAFVEESGRDDDYLTVDNLESVVFNGGYDWLMTVFGPSVVLLDASAELGEASGPYGPLPTVSVDAVLDGVDTVMDGDSEAFKRLPDAVDAGFTWHDGPYSGTALHRVRTDGDWQDTNNSSADFEIGLPEPTLPSQTDGVFGEPFIVLGDGSLNFAPLEPGADIELVAGTQGGWHLDVSVWFGGFGPGGVELHYEAVDVAANRVSFVTQALLSERSVIAGDEGWYRFGDRVVLDIQRENQVVGEELIVRLTASLGEQTWSDEQSVTVVDDE